jgi:two-component system response regulator NreC
MDVLIVDDHAVVRAGLHQLLDAVDEIDLIEEASSLHEALEAELSPDVIVADLILGDATGPEITAALRRRFPAARVLVLTMVDAPATVEAVLAAGCHGYLTKEAAASEVVAAIRAVGEGRDYLQPELGVALARHAARRPPTADLSSREREVLRLVALGHTHTEIGAMLSVSVRTVETHRASVTNKLGARTRADLVRAAIDLRLVDFSGEP